MNNQRYTRIFLQKDGKDMKIKNLFLTIFTLLILVIGSTMPVSADTATDLSSMKVYAVDASGNKTEVKMDFSPTTYTYDLTVLSTAVKIEIEAVPADSTSTAAVIKDGINTVVDTGMNLTEVSVTSAAGTVQKYTLNTKKLTQEEEATYQAPENNDTGDDTTVKKNSGDAVVNVGKTEMKISSSFSKSDIPEGFVKSSQKYDGKKYSCIKGEVKNLTAFYLYNDETEGFYIYDENKDSFYAMNNIQIKSRMYTIVKPEKKDGILKNYDKKKVTIIDKEIEAWALDEEAGMYLVYAMNWNGDTGLYCYDDNEKCFQRYLVSNDANKQSAAAAKAYDNLEKDYNKLVDKYNLFLKITCGLVVVIIILIFVCINIGLNKKEKRIKKDKKDKNSPYTQEDNNDIDYVVHNGTVKDKEQEAEVKDFSEEIEETEDIENGIEETAEEIVINVEEEARHDNGEEEITPILDLETDDFEEAQSLDKQSKDTDNVKDGDTEDSQPKFFSRDMMRTYGDEPTFGLELESDEGFYGGEDDEDGDVFIDITDDENEMPKKEQIENDTKEAQKKTEEDIKETLKSILSDDDDDDFEFIDID